ncbi:MAG: VWA domain-containing protein [Oscillochloris sp.]|nr:VWA domain-containing protein [Oscillochloris sp.]
MSTFILGTLLIGLVALYIISPPIRRKRLSAARFLTPLPNPPRPLGGRIRFRRLVTSPLFWLQLLVLTLLFWAVWAANAQGVIRGPQSIGLWLIVDTSASMSSIQSGAPRMVEAQQVALEVIGGSATAAESQGWCVQLAAFDLEWRELATSGDPSQAINAVSQLSARPLGTDLDLLRSRLTLTEAEGAPSVICPITDVVVIADRPAPQWLAELPFAVKWRDLAQPLPNVGFSAIEPVRNTLTGEIVEIRYEIVAYGPQAGVSSLRISGPDGMLREEQLSWANVRVIQDRFRPTSPGEYRLALSADGVYEYDDEIRITIPASEAIRLDWQLADRSLLEQLNWTTSQTDPLVLVISHESLDRIPSDIPTLIVGPGYATDPPVTPQVIGYFDERSLLLADLNFDVAEQVGMPRVSGLPQDIAAVMSGSDGAIWIGLQTDPAVVYVPGLPRWSDDNAGAFTQTVFFNALRFLLGERDFSAIYTLTSPANPEPEGTRLAFHPGEGNTDGEAVSIGQIDRWEPAPLNEDQGRLWPLLVVLASALLLIERTVLLLWGKRWN